MIITEAELREAWQNGRGTLPEFPQGTRFTPAARDFIASLGAAGAAAGTPGQAATDTLACGQAVAGDGSMELHSTDGRRLIITSVDVDGIVEARPQSLVVHPDVTITDAARERLRNAGIRVLPFVEKKATEVPADAAVDEALFGAAKRAIMAKLEGRADEALVEAVLRRVLASLPPTAG